MRELTINMYQVKGPDGKYNVIADDMNDLRKAIPDIDKMEVTEITTRKTPTRVTESVDYVFRRIFQ